jgi:two-component system LytT family response regulator
VIYRALVVDDEPIARSALRGLLGDVPWLVCVGEAGDGPAAIAAIMEQRPDLVFLDVRMPGATGIEVLERTSATAPGLAVIFTTAHDDYAMTAFELGAIDYLRKPFGRERFLRAVERARPQLEAATARRAAESDANAEAAAGAPLAERLAFAQEAPRPLTRIFVRDRGAVVPIAAEQIVRCEADGDYVAVYAGGRRHLIYVNLGDLTAQLDPARFVRVHRSHLVNLDHVAALTPHDANRLELRLRDGGRVVASRAGTQLLRAKMK